MASGPTTLTLVFNDKAFPRLYMNGFKYRPKNPPRLFGQLWYCAEYERKGCQKKVSTSLLLYNVKALNYDSNLNDHDHDSPEISSSSIQCSWKLYKYYFCSSSSRGSMETGLVSKEEVSAIPEMIALLDMNHTNDDDPAAFGRFQYCFFQSKITTELIDDSHNQFEGKFILLFREPMKITRESLYGCWRALLTCIMQGTFASYTYCINGAKVHFWGNGNPTLPPHISVWTSVDFPLKQPGSSLPILGEMLRKLFEPLVNVQYLRRGQNLGFN